MTETEKTKKKFSITIKQQWCKGCYICLDICPKDIFDCSQEVSRLGFRHVRAAKAEQCTGCLLCELMCPDVAIRIEEKDGTHAG